MTFKTLLFIVLGTLVTMATTWAQPAPDKSSAYFRTIGAGVAPTDLFYSDGGPKPVPVAVGVEGRSSYYRLPNRTKPLAFFRLSKGADGKDAYVPVAQVNLADLGRHSLMVFSRSLTEKNALVVTGLKDDAEAVPGGSCRFVNLLQKGTGVLLGGQKIVLAPGQSVVAPASPAPNKTAVQVMVYTSGQDGEATRVYATIWPNNSTKRGLVLIVPTPDKAAGAEIKYLPETITQLPTD